MAFAAGDISIALAGEHIHHYQRGASLQLLAACPVVAIAALTAFVAAVAASGLSAMEASTANTAAVADA